MLRPIATALLAAGLSTPVHAGDNDKALDTQRLAVNVSATGDVTSVAYETQAPASIRTMLEAAVRDWKFVPQVVDGAPVPWATYLDVALVAEPIPQGYRLRVARAETVNLVVTRRRSPVTPIGATRTLKNALVCAELSLGPDGDTPTIEAMWVDDKPVGEDNPYRRSLRQVLPRWRFAGVEIDGRRWPGGSLRVPIMASDGEMADLVYAMHCQMRAPTLATGFRLSTPVAGTVLKPVAPAAAAVN